MAAADLVVLPAKAEPFGLVLLEAMALGKAVIATDAGGPRDIVVDGETGRLVAPSDSAALAAAMHELLADPDRCRAMGDAGRRRFERQFTAARMASDTAAVYAAAVYGEAAGEHEAANEKPARGN
jgi:glycosyltransferase involved in cell wall biosynthesis